MQNNINNRGGVIRHKLSNGMTVLLKEQHSAPVTSWIVMYRIGSRNEPTGLTGVSHWVEHMMFKGTDEFPAGYLDKAIDREGGHWNAMTSFDYTAYYETMPADRIDLGLRLEADRMIKAKFDPEEVKSERTVIISERQGSENSPFFWLGEELQATAFRVHGYHHEIIGDMIDLETMTRDDLYNHYKRHYMPNNAIAAIVGDFDTETMIKRVEELYGNIPTGDLPKLFVRPEPPPQGERRVRVERPGPTKYLAVAYRVPAATDPDWMKLYMLDSILGGASGFGGGGVGNKTSRFYKSLVKTELAAAVGSGMMESIDPFLYMIYVTLHDHGTLEEVEAAVLAELDKVIAGDITQAELDKAKKQARALFAYSTESVSSQAYNLAFFEHVTGDYNWFLTFEDRLREITLNDVQEVAAKYLVPTGRTVGWFVPTAADGSEDMDDEDDIND